MVDASRGSGVRLAELVAALSLATDLGLGQPQEHVLRQTVLARRLAAAAGLGDREQSAVFYVSLLAWVGCVADSHELGIWFGDDIRLRSEAMLVDKAGLPMARFALSHVGDGLGPVRRMTMIGRFLASGPRHAARSMLTHCQANAEIAIRFGLGPEVARALGQVFERWDGSGVPGHASGEDIDAVVRVVQLADDAAVFCRGGGAEAAIEVLRSRRGSEFDPNLVDLFCSRAAELTDGVSELDAWDEVLGPAVGLGGELSEAELTESLRVFADYADLKSPSFLGHSRQVGTLAARAAAVLGLPAGELAVVERAGLVHDLGVIGIPANVWDKAGPLSLAESERVRTHPYLTERTLARPERLTEIGALAGLHHERLDGSGYPRSVRGDGLSVSARVLAVADAYQTSLEERPHRPGRTPREAAAALQEDARRARLDGEAVNAVLTAAGHRVRRRPTLPAGLTSREVEVLELLARGFSNKQIAARMCLSARTVSSHVEHVYSKIGVSTRGAAALFAMQVGLINPQPRDADRNMG